MDNTFLKGKINIIIVHDVGSITGGGPRIAINEALSLAEEGYDVVFFCGAGPIDERLEKAGVKVVCLNEACLNTMLTSFRDKLVGAVKGLWNRKVQKAFSELLKKFDSSNTVVHFHGWSQALSASCFLETAKSGFKTVITCHDHELACPGRVFYNYKKGMICQRPAMSVGCVLSNCDKRGYAQKIYRVIRQWILLKVLKKNDLSVIYLNEFSRQRIKSGVHVKHQEYIVRNMVDFPSTIDVIPQNNTRYIYIGRASPEKGIELFCEAVARAGVKADVLGVSDKFGKLAKRYSGIRFLGWVPPEDMKQYLIKARCLIVSSLCVETGPLTVPETQCAYYLPCIIPEQCGAAEDVIAEGTGLTYKIGDVDSLVSCIEKCKDDDVIKEFSDNCKRIDASKYSSKTHVKRLVSVYKRLLAK